MTEQEHKAWQKKLLEEIKRSRFAPVKPPKKTKAPKPFTWRATSSTDIPVTKVRAERLARAGEYVSPNPFCDYAKYGLEVPQ